MLTATPNLYLSISIQLILTLFLIAVLWSLYSRLHRFEFFRWWAWAWTAFSCFLASATVSLYLGTTWTPLKAVFIFSLLVSGLLQPVLLVLGGLSWSSPNRPTKRWLWWGISLAISTATVCFVAAFFLRANPLASFATRNIPRTLTQAAALFFCFGVFWRHFRKTRSVAAAITGFFCFTYACDQVLYFLSFSEMAANHWGFHYPGLLHRVASLEVFDHAWLLYLDLVDTCGICLGMILLLLERHQVTASELEASERRRLGLAVDNVSLQIQIRERERIESELRHSEEFTRRVVLNSPMAMIVSRRPSERVEFVNDRFISLFGYTKEEISEISDWWPRAYPDPEYRKSVQAEWQHLIDKANQGTSEQLVMEACVCCRNGSFRDIEFHLSVVNDLYLVSSVDLTERNEALRNLRESESRYRDLVEHSEDLLGTHDLDGRILSINPAPCRRLGYTVEEVLQKQMQDLLAPRFRHLFPAFVRRVLENGFDKGYMTVVTRTGEERVWEYHSTLKKDGVPVIRGMAHDVTERIRAEESLRQSEKKFATAFRASPHAMTITSLRDGRFIDVNASFERQSGYSRDEILGKTILELGLWDDSADFAAIMADTLKRQKVFGRQARLRTKSGRTVYALYSVEVIDIDGEPCALSAGEDITNRIQIERALRESEAKFRLVADTVTSAIWLLQGDQLVYFNREFEKLIGYSREELLSMSPWDLVHPDFREQSRARAAARLRGEPVPSRYQFAIVTKSGEKRWVDFSAAVTEFDGKPTLFGSAFDITATRRAEQELKERAMYMDALISNTPLGIVIKDEHQRVRFCNAAFEEMFQFKQSEIQSKNLDDFIAPHAHEEASLLSNAVQKGGVVHTIARRRRKDGTLLDVELYGVKVVSGDSFVGAFGIYQDITERKRSEEKLNALRNRLTRAQEEERARIARDLHDDAGQRLALLSIDLEQLKQASAKLRSSLTEQLESLVKAASEITSDIHNVSRRLHPSQVELLGLPAALTNFCRDFGVRNGMEIEFAVTAPQQKPSQEAALCLFRVAQEAIRNVQKHSGTRRALVQLDEVSGSLRLRIFDEGDGFDPESSEYSEGLGLLSMQERLHSLGGELFIHSRRGGGTCIEACIPLSPTVAA
jgi:two-component system NarL family sensor kinase